MTDKTCKCNKCLGVYKVFFVTTIFIIVYFLLIFFNYGDKLVQNDFMNKVVFNVPGSTTCCSWWPVSHFVLFFILGLLFPECDVPVLVGGVLWELFETFLSFSKNQPDKHQSISRGNKVEYINWWSGSIKDIIFNTMGFYFGKSILKVMNKKVAMCIPQINGELCDEEKCKKCS